jgi:hypothetical protein
MLFWIGVFFIVMGIVKLGIGIYKMRQELKNNQHKE